MSHSVLTKIEDNYLDLSKSHKRIADYVLANYEKAAFLTAAKLGEETGISVSTVVRFATSLGYEGYPEFQDALRETIKGKLTSTQRIEVAGTQIRDNDLLGTILQKDSEMIRSTMAEVDPDAFDKASKAINKARRIYIVGVRSSAALANFMYFYFNLIYDDVRLLSSNSSSEMFEDIYRIGPEDVCVALSFPRYSKHVLRVVSYAGERGAKTIAITDHADSPIAEVADYTLVAKSNMVSFIDSLVAPLSLVNALIVSSARGSKTAVRRKLAELEEIWEKFDIYKNMEEDDRAE
ncbi:MAG: MurR/RpiR family transcriptional regulator [Clostridia bacterium]|nr:MurR/RpiR family transcriptional regulator [Clostridia bacterium]MBR5753481.1 MurR/RpiR family transcriptional regulator [Clostridia bacterium]